jgi:hypothetical protein
VVGARATAGRHGVRSGDVRAAARGTPPAGTPAGRASERVSSPPPAAANPAAAAAHAPSCATSSASSGSAGARPATARSSAATGRPHTFMYPRGRASSTGGGWSGAAADDDDGDDDDPDDGLAAAGAAPTETSHLAALSSASGGSPHAPARCSTSAAPTLCRVPPMPSLHRPTTTSRRAVAAIVALPARLVCARAEPRDGRQSSSPQNNADAAAAHGGTPLSVEVKQQFARGSTRRPPRVSLDPVQDTKTARTAPPPVVRALPRPVFQPAPLSDAPLPPPLSGL